MPDPLIEVVMPSIPPREQLRQRALASIAAQTLKAAAVHVVLDTDRHGPHAARNVGLAQVSPAADWVAFLDDDDYWHPHHLQTLYDLHLRTGATFLHSWFDGNEALQRTWGPQRRYRQIDPAAPHHVTMTVMVAAELARRVRFTPPAEGAATGGEDWRFIRACAEQGAVFAGTPRVTWSYVVHGANTSGLPDRW